MYRWPLLPALLALYGCAVPPVKAAAQPAIASLPAAAAAAAPVVAPANAPPLSASAPPPAVVPPAAEPSTTMDDDVDDGLDDAYADTEDPPPPGAAPKSPTLALSDAEIRDRLKKDPSSIGSISLGRASAGALVNGVQMPRGDHWDLISPSCAWGTKETVDSLAHVIDKVNEQFPGSQPVQIGHISARDGGHLSPHVSHQAGRDVDVGYYYRTLNPHGFANANDGNLDYPRTWALVRAALKDTDVEWIFIDTAIQRGLAQYAASIGEDAAWLDDIFQSRGKNGRSTIRHAKGHGTHLHIRFHNPVAEELGRRCAFLLPPRSPAAHQLASATAAASVTYAQHRARSGDTLVVLAKHYGTTIEEIQRANGLKSIALKQGVVYRIPQKLGTKTASRGVARATVPQRRSAAGAPGSSRGNAAQRR
ncbi:MAG: penicillin-insensitive murein endopeptidase [Byssovorax sp.]